MLAALAAVTGAALLVAYRARGIAPPDLSDFPAPTRQPRPSLPKRAPECVELVDDRCPGGMAFVPGGPVTVMFEGERWDGVAYEETTVGDFCIDRYEASQPDATASSPGSWSYGDQTPAAASRAGVMPWTTVPHAVAMQACERAGKRLPTLAEWQLAYSGPDPYAYPWGNEWEDRRCRVGQANVDDVAPTGACCVRVCGHPAPGDEPGGYAVCDMVGNVSEMLSTPWDESCFGDLHIMLAGGSARDTPELRNVQESMLERPGCFWFQEYGLSRAGLHHHPRIPPTGNSDDGFRCAMDAPSRRETGTRK
ncbi:formylglycine-generating enzyme family protein [bacterium]|nr:formylglycine-generating enzyme family protein [bacterium]